MCPGGRDADVAPVAAAVAAGYPIRTNLMPVGDLGAPPRWYRAGAPPLRVLKLGVAAPDPEFVKQLKPKLGSAILDPEKDLTAEQRKDLAAFLGAAFGTPAAPVVRPLSAADATR